ncbi:hypothetical protein LTR62_002698 [Meristemomyces frigidus]|uniref:ASST-domain-containing protein n=1 Tax=Meristemomyces frigidus TaxID=1508187 RepID=A0AAN7YHF3_9PEZI|nr:hypothetical protein LTR62_002698 [Meristemomyces frigidus]
MNVCLLFLWHLAICLRIAFADDDNTFFAKPPARPEYDEAVDNGTYGSYPTRSYGTVEGLRSPQTNYLQWNERCDDGLFNFITPRGWSLPDPGPMILDNNGDLIWSEHFEGESSGQAYDFRVQKFMGQEYLTFWLGDDRVRGHGSGFYYMLNSSYDIVHRVGAANGLSADLHEFLITPEGTALMTMYEVMAHDVTDFRDFDAEKEEDREPNYIWDCLFQEVDVANGNLIFEWRASDHVPLNHTYHGIGPGGTKEDPFDWFHINSVQKDDLGNYLISARYTHSIIYIDGRTGDIIWTLGGRGNAFMDISDGFAINFAWQHDARFHAADTFPNLYWPPNDQPGYTTKLLTLFDNAVEDQHYEYGMTYSRGLLLAVSYPNTPTASEQARRSSDVPSAQIAELYTEPENNFNKLRETNGTNPDYKVRLIKAYINPNHIHSFSQGSVQVLSQPGTDPKVLVGYGLNAAWTEFSATGTVLCDVHFGASTSFELGDIQSYRTYKLSWTGRPETPPAFDISDDDVEVYVSWNGATEVRSWVLQCSETLLEEGEVEDAWADVVRVSKQGFETVIPLPDDPPRFMRVLALDEAGRKLDYGVSEIIDRRAAAATAAANLSLYLKVGGERLKASVAEMSTTRIFVVAAAGASTMLVLYEGYRRYLTWRMGRWGGSAWRWRRGGTGYTSLFQGVGSAV